MRKNWFLKNSKLNEIKKVIAQFLFTWKLILGNEKKELIEISVYCENLKNKKNYSCNKILEMSWKQFFVIIFLI